jgi:pimeloyl-ACP methyl ester carboxylesterase
VTKLQSCLSLSVVAFAISTILVPESASQANAQPFDLSVFKSHAGGYLRNENNKRVVVFVNGIFGDALSTWSNGKDAYWPLMLTRDHDFDHLDIYVHSFDSPKLSNAHGIDELAGSLNDYLVSDKVLEKHDQVIFVCHSMGGLVVRAYLLRIRPSPKKVPMIYFFATPTTGANITEIARHTSANPQLNDMLPLKEDGYVGELQNQWLATSEDQRLNYPSTIASFCAYEKLDTYGVRIVERQSATNLCNRETRGILANHIDIVKPLDDRSEPYIAFKSAYDRTFGLTGVLLRAAAEWDGGEQREGWSSGTEIATSTEKLGVARVKTTTDLTVDCTPNQAGEIRANFDHKPFNGKIVQVVPVVEGWDDQVSSSFLTLVNYDNDGATIRYNFGKWGREGAPPCPPHHTHILANVVFSSYADTPGPGPN